MLITPRTKPAMSAHLYGHSLALAVMAFIHVPLPNSFSKTPIIQWHHTRGPVRSRSSWVAGAVRLRLPSGLAVPLLPELHARGARVHAEPPDLRRLRPQIGGLR